MLQNVRLLIPPIPTIEEIRLFAVLAVVATAMFSKLLTVKSLSPRAKKQVARAVQSSWIHPKNHQQQHRLLWSFRSLTALQKTPNQECPVAPVAMILAVIPHNFQRIFPGREFRKSSINVSLCSAICSDAANVSTTETLFVGCALLPTLSVAFTRMIPSFFLKAFLPFLISKRYNSPSSLSRNSSLPAS